VLFDVDRAYFVPYYSLAENAMQFELHQLVISL